MKGSKVAEQPVFWLGGKPGNKAQGQQPPVAESYEGELRKACEACGFAVDEYVVAQGGFGGWLAHLDHDGTAYRLFWSGKSGQLTLESMHEPAGWQEERSEGLADADLAGFVAAVRVILRHDSANG